MKYRVELTAKAEWDVDGVLRWFHERHATAAGGRWLRNLMARIDTLEKHPARCRLANRLQNQTTGDDSKSKHNHPQQF